MTDNHRKYFLARLAARNAREAYHGHPEYKQILKVLYEARDRIDEKIKRLEQERKQAYVQSNTDVKASEALEEIRTQRVVPAEQAEQAARSVLYKLGYTDETFAHLYGYGTFNNWCRDLGYVKWDRDEGQELVTDKGRQAIAEAEAEQ